MLLIAGCLRADTAVISRIASIFGYSVANKQYISTINHDILDALGGYWDDPPDRLAVGKWTDQNCLIASRSQIKQLSSNRPLVIEDPKLSLTLPLWLEAFPESSVIVSVENPAIVVASMVSRYGFSEDKSLRLWHTYSTQTITSVPSNQTMFVHLESLNARPYDEIAKMLFVFGYPFLKIDENSMNEAVISVALRPRKDRVRRQDLLNMSINPHVRVSVLEIYSYLRTMSGQTKEPSRISEEIGVLA